MTTSTAKNSANPEIIQDRVFDLVDTFDKHACVMFHQQWSVYMRLAVYIEGKDVLEAGCGNGVGSAILERTARSMIATDKLQRNIGFAHALYPWIEFATWDLNNPIPLRRQVVVCVETLEHVTDALAAIGHLIAAAEEEVWISTPNGIGKPRPPENPYHVCEYTSQEMLDMIGDHEVTVRDWETWKRIEVDTLIDPLVYQIKV